MLTGPNAQPTQFRAEMDQVGSQNPAGPWSQALLSVPPTAAARTALTATAAAAVVTQTNGDQARHQQHATKPRAALHVHAARHGCRLCNQTMIATCLVAEFKYSCLLVSLGGAHLVHTWAVSVQPGSVMHVYDVLYVPACCLPAACLPVSLPHQVLALSAGLDDVNKTIAEVWADGPDSTFPPGHW
jgi:hypothetical protein